MDAYLGKKTHRAETIALIHGKKEALLGEVPMSPVWISQVDISEGFHVAWRNSSKRNCDIGVAFPISLE